VGFVDLLEFLLRPLLVLGDVRMVLPRELAEGLLDVVVRGIPRHAEGLIVVFELHVRDAGKLAGAERQATPR
jgi:hypothetical protein